jgi:hypothetical protein
MKGTFVCSIYMVPNVKKPPESKVIFSIRLGLVALFPCPFPSLVATESPPLKIGSPLDSPKTTETPLFLQRNSSQASSRGDRYNETSRHSGSCGHRRHIRKVFISRAGGLTVYEFDREVFRELARAMLIFFWATLLGDSKVKCSTCQ